VAVGEVAAAVRRTAGEAAYARIRWEPDPQIQQIISGWPQGLQAARAKALGFAADTGIDEVIQAFIEDDLEAQKQLV
jgi:nucleoside-diphosphate-sugar epimerase